MELRVSSESLVVSRKYLIAFMLLFFVGCCGTKEFVKEEFETKTSTITVPVPPVVDTLDAKEDSARVYGEKIIERDTVIKVEYYPLEKKIYIKVKPDSIIVIKTDTLTVYKFNQVYKEPGFFEKEFWFIAGFMLLLIILIFLLKK